MKITSTPIQIRQEPVIFIVSMEEREHFQIIVEAVVMDLGRTWTRTCCR